MKDIEEKKHLFATNFLRRMLDIHFYILKVMSQYDINWVWKVQYRRSLIFICGSFLKQYWYIFEIKEKINKYFPHKMYCFTCVVKKMKQYILSTTPKKCCDTNIFPFIHYDYFTLNSMVFFVIMENKEHFSLLLNYFHLLIVDNSVIYRHWSQVKL